MLLHMGVILGLVLSPMVQVVFMNLIVVLVEANSALVLIGLLGDLVVGLVVMAGTVVVKMSSVVVMGVMVAVA